MVAVRWINSKLRLKQAIEAQRMEKYAQDQAIGCGLTTERVKNRPSYTEIPCVSAIWGTESLELQEDGTQDGAIRKRAWLGKGLNGKSLLRRLRESEKAMSRRAIVGALSLVIVAVLVYLYQSEPDIPSPSNGVSTVSPDKIPRDAGKTPPSVTPQPTDRPTQPALLTGSISGTARIHGTNAPATGVSVRAVSRKVDIALTRTDRKGSYTLAGLVPGTVIRITAENEQNELIMLDVKVPRVVLQPGEARTGVDLRLRQYRLSSISGKVVGRRVFYQKVDDLTSKTTAKDFARVEDTAWPGVKIFLQGMEDPSRKEAISDEAGRYRFDRLRPDDYIVWAVRPEGAAIQAIGDRPEAHPSDIGVNTGSNPWLHFYLKSEPVTDADFHFRLDGVSITGRVTDANGNPIEGAKLSMEFGWKKGPEIRRWDHFDVSAISDKEGCYLLADLPPVSWRNAYEYVAKGGVLSGWYEVHVQAEGFPPARRKVPPFTANLIDTSMRLVEDTLPALLQLMEAGPDKLDLKDFRFPEVDLPNSEGDVITDIDFVLHKEAVVAGRVLDTWGNIVTPGAIRMVYADPPSSETVVFDLPSEGVTRLDEAGRFRFANLGPGKYFFEVGTTDGDQKARNEILVVRAGDVIEDLNVIVESAEDRGNILGLLLDTRSREPIEISGRGRDTQSGKLRTDEVSVTHVDSPEEPTPVRGRATIDPSQKGGFLIEGISPGTATLRLSPSGYMPQEAQVEVVSGQTTKRAFYLEPRGNISGRVLDARTETPIEAFEVKVTRVESSVEERPTRGKVTIDESQEGSFLIADISPGTATLEITALGYGGDRAQVEVVSGLTTKKTFRLGSARRLLGYITLNGEPQEADVSVRRTSEERDDRIKTRSDRTGYYEFKGLGEGEYWVGANFIFKATPRSTRTDLARVNLEAGDTRLDFNFQDDAGIRGTFTCPEGKTWSGIQVLDPRRDASLPVRDRYCAQFWNGRQKSWNYEIRTLPPGTYTVIGKCRTMDGQSPFIEKSKIVTLEAGQIEQVDFVFP